MRLEYFSSFITWTFCLKINLNMVINIILCLPLQITRVQYLRKNYYTEINFYRFNFLSFQPIANVKNLFIFIYLYL